jgi:non-ribosomal peptide synthetase component F
METSTVCEEVKRPFTLLRRDGSSVSCRIPGDYTVGEAVAVLAERSGYEPQHVAADTGMGYRLAVQGEGGLRLLDENSRFADIQEDSQLKIIPSLAPARPAARASA